MNLNDVWKDREKHKGIAMYFAKNEMLADDVLSEFYIKLEKKRQRDGNFDFATYKGKLNDSYLFTMIRSCYYDIIRKEHRYSDAPIGQLRQEDKSEPMLLEHHLRGLSWYEKKLTEVYFREEHSIRSLAKATNISTTNIFTTLKKTRGIIRQSMNKEVIDAIQDFVKESRDQAGVKPKYKSTKGKPDPNSKYYKAKNKKEKAIREGKALGLGDTVEAITKATGIKKVVDKVFDKFGVDCGCEERKVLLNKLFPYKKTSCMTKEQFVVWTETKRNFEANQIHDIELKNIARLHSELFNHRYHEPCRCEPKTWKTWIGEIDRIYESYKNDTVKAIEI